MREIKHLDMTGHRIWKDKNIKPECKRIYAYLYSKGFDKTDIHVNVGDLQKIIQIKNVGFRNNLKILERFKYLTFTEYDTCMYEVHIYQIGKTLVNNGTVNARRFMLVPCLYRLN